MLYGSTAKYPMVRRCLHAAKVLEVAVPEALALTVTKQVPTAAAASAILRPEVFTKRASTAAAKYAQTQT